MRLHSPLGFKSMRLLYTESLKTPASVKDALSLWEDIFKKNKIPEPSTSIQIIMHSVLGAKNLVEVQSLLGKELDLNQRKQLDGYCLQRLSRMPVQYIIGEWEFRDLTLGMRSPVFIPRPETEQLIDIVVPEQGHKSPGNILEVGCGSGAISIALAKAFTQANIFAVDASEEACNLTKDNCKRFEFCERVKVVNTKLMENGSFVNGSLPDRFDILVSNPPYIKTEDMRTLQPEITFYEDLRALDGGLDGMQVITALLLLASKTLERGGRLYLEIDPSLIHPIRQWTVDNQQLGLELSDVHKDVYKVDRFVSISK
ncbi:hypothetical protein LSTR_LSTR013697 [Laodelphax striatellus]|uniref:peptide chain release factor N(5)-glutamine methyltransferase n=1 Tax=Laodelphax striatellus TaxID=195883 RepID=A0A482WYN1_LAOST|nr:hypothetical protein LSTR_LSTR013697 [Laodelphax striatellus]